MIALPAAAIVILLVAVAVVNTAGVTTVGVNVPVMVTLPAATIVIVDINVTGSLETVSNAGLLDV